MYNLLKSTSKLNNPELKTSNWMGFEYFFRTQIESQSKIYENYSFCKDVHYLQSKATSVVLSVLFQ